MTKQNSCWVSNESSNRTIFSWRSFFKIWISCLKLLRSFSDFPLYNTNMEVNIRKDYLLLINFKAAICPVCFFLPLNTFPNDPSPIWCNRWYLSMILLCEILKNKFEFWNKLIDNFAITTYRREGGKIFMSYDPFFPKRKIYYHLIKSLVWYAHFTRVLKYRYRDLNSFEKTFYSCVSKSRDYMDNNVKNIQMSKLILQY